MHVVDDAIGQRAGQDQGGRYSRLNTIEPEALKSWTWRLGPRRRVLGPPNECPESEIRP